MDTTECGEFLTELANSLGVAFDSSGVDRCCAAIAERQTLFLGGGMSLYEAHATADTTTFLLAALIGDIFLQYPEVGTRSSRENSQLLKPLHLPCSPRG